MPSSITLTVSHLPTSASFFLSALQPLQYTFRGRSGNCISFGPENSNAPPDFWISQETPGVPAGAAHVAFPAVSRAAVQDFFVAAIKAGGKVHGEPCVRDQYGYYSAAVIDFDGNSIEAVHRPGFDDANKENETQTTVSKQSKALTQRSRAPSATKSSLSKAKSATVSQAPPTALQRPQRQHSGDVLDNIINDARSAANVARDLVNQVRPHLSSTQSTPAAPTPHANNNSDDAVVGTLLGVAAGAAISWAFKGNDTNSNSCRPQPRRSSTTGHDSRYEEARYQSSGYKRPEAPPSSYSQARNIAMYDNDYTSIASARTHRRGSYDSGLGSSPDSTTASRRNGRKQIEAPPSSYRGATPAYSSSPGNIHRSSSQSRHSDSGSYRPDTKTIYHVQEVRRRSTHPPPAPSTTSKYSTTSHKTARQKDYPPAPPTRATTWTAGERHDTDKGKHSSKHSSYVTSKPKSSKSKHKGSSSMGDSEMTKSVIGKVRAMRHLDVTDDELRPSDSVSQISSVRSGRRRS